MRRSILRAIPILVVVVLASFAAPATEPATQGYWTLRGDTDQGHRIRLRLDTKDRVRTFELRGDQHCTNGSTTSSGWHPSEGGAPAKFAGRGPRLDATEFRRFEHDGGSVSTTNAMIQGSVSKRRASGRLSLTTTYRWPDGRYQACETGSVEWTAD